MNQVTQSWLQVFLSFILATLPCWPVSAQITPNGLGTQVDHQGQQFNITGGTQAGRNLFHSFQRFGLTQGQVANFFSNPNIANILARVNGGSASYINGLIQVLGGNSNLFLMNPSGIVFGPNASLNVPAAFSATTADRILFPGGSFNAFGNNDYAQLVGEPIGFAFDRKDPAAIINEGKLAVNPGQSVSLIAGQVINTGTVQAPGGNITITAVPGENLVRLSQSGQLLSLEFNPQQAAQYADSSGNIPIMRLPELLTGGGVTTVTQNSNGTVSVTGSNLQIPTATGTAIVSGVLDVSSSSQTGGNVGVFGTNIALVNNKINASGFTGGGEILIGGEFQGKGTQPNAQYTYVNSGSQLLANAVNTGDGGRVIVWADKNTQFQGTISAKGGELSGDGGFVEVSGKENLGFQGKVDTSAPQGKSGTLLLDPDNITIVLSGGSNDIEIADGIILFGDGLGDFTISVSALVTALSTGDVMLQATNDITLQAGLDYNGIGAVRDLIFKANNDIIINAAIGDSAPGGEQLNINLLANFDGMGSGNIVNNSPVIIKTEGGNFTASGVDINVNGFIETTNTTGNSGNINLTATGAVNLKAGTSLKTDATGNNNAGSITITAPNGFTSDSSTVISSNVTGSGIGNGGDITITAANGFTSNSSITTFVAGTGANGNAGSVSITSGADLTIATNSLRTLAEGTGNGGAITLNASGLIDTSGVFVESSSIGGGIGGNITFNAGGTIRTGDIFSSGVAGGGSIDITSGSDVNITNLFSDSTNGIGGNITVNATGVIDTTSGTVSSASTGGGNGGAITFFAGSDILSKDIFSTGEAGGNISLTSATGNINLANAPFGISSAGPTTGSGSITITATNGTITAPNILSSSINSQSGVINITSGSDVNITNLFSDSINGIGGNITVNAAGNINVVDVLANVTGLGSGTGGNLSFTSTNGAIQITGNTNTSTFGTGAGGSVTLTAKNSIDVSNTIFTVANGAAASGDITIISTDSTITTNQLNSSSFTSGDGGKVKLKASGDINVNAEIFSTANGLDDGGAIEITSTLGKVDVIGIVSSVSNVGTAGDVTITAKGTVSLPGGLVAFGNNGGGNVSVVNNTDSITIGTFSLNTTGGVGVGGNVNLQAATTIDVPFGIKTTSNLQGGDIALNADGDITIGNGSFFGLRSFGTGTGNAGAIQVTSTGGSLNVNSDLKEGIIASALDGIAGSININVANDVNVTGVITSGSFNNVSKNTTIKAGGDVNVAGEVNASTFLPGGAGLITIAGNDVTLTDGWGTGNGGGVNITANTLTAGASSSGSGSVNLVVGDVNFLGTIKGLGFLGQGTISITAPSGGVFVNDTGAGLNLSPADLAQLDGFKALTLGSSNIPLTVGTGGITFTTSTALVGNTVNVQGNVSSPGALTLSATNNLLLSGNLNATSITLNSGGNSDITGNLTSAGGPTSFNIVNTLNFTQNLNLNDPTTIQAGSINSNGFNIFNTNFDTNILSPGVINLNDIITAGGNVNINGGSSVLVNNIQTFSSGGSGAINITASGDIKTGNLQTEITSSPNNAAPISLTSGGTVTTGDIFTFAQGGGDGGAVKIIASTAVTTQVIDTSSTTGTGGNVFIDPIGDVQVKTINTQGVIQGGNVAITAGRYFRATGTFIDNGGVTSSISTQGGSGGAITIKHGGNGIVPFIVGDASVNGSLGAITTGAFTISPLEQFLSSTILGNIQILTVGGGSKSIINNILFPTQSGNSSLEIKSIQAETILDTNFIINNILFSTEFGNSPLEIELNGGETTLDMDAIDTAEIADRLAAGDIEAVTTLDQLFLNQFADFYGVEPLNNFRSVAEVQIALADMAARTGTRPALLYNLSDERQLNLVLIPPGRGQGVADIPILKVALNP